jgi:hypothetical protein
VCQRRRRLFFLHHGLSNAIRAPSNAKNALTFPKIGCANAKNGRAFSIPGRSVAKNAPTFPVTAQLFS